MTEFRDYYQRELQALYQAGEQFAAAEPALARHLAATGSDPDVERLLQGVAYLSARAARQQDGQLAQQARTLLEILCPMALTPVPAGTILQFHADSHQLSGQKLIAAGSTVRSTAAATGPILFRTSSDLVMTPLQLTDCELQPRSGGARLSLSLCAHAETRADWRLPATIRMFINRPAGQAGLWYRLLHSAVDRVQMQLRTRRRYAPLELSPECIRPWGHGDADALFSDPARDLPSLRLLREYFCFPERYLFIDVQLPAALRHGDGPVRELRIDMDLSQTPDPSLAAVADLFLLHCTPATNLFALPARPFTRNRPGGEWTLQAEPRRYGSPWVHDALSVTGVRSDQGEVVPFTLYQPGQAVAAGDGQGCCLGRRPGCGEADMELFLSFPAGSGAAPQWVMSAELLCSDGPAACGLLAGDRMQTVDEGLEWLQATSVTRASPARPPLSDSHRYWSFICNTVAARAGFADLRSLRDSLLLASLPVLSEPAAMEDFRHRLQGLQAMHWRPRVRYLHGAALAGRVCRLGVDPRRLAMGEGLYLFLSVLYRAMLAMTPVNTFVELEVVDSSDSVLACFRHHFSAVDSGLHR